MKCRSVAVVVCSAAVLVATTASAAPILVPNHSFETPAVIDQTSSTVAPPGWTLGGDFNGGVEVFNPSNVSYSGTTGAGAIPGTGDGQQLAGIHNAAAVIAGNWHLTSGVVAIVGDNMTYMLTAALGNRKTANPSEFNYVELLVNGVVVASTEVGRAAIVNDTFTDFSTSFSTGAADPLSGGNLAIRLRARETQFFVFGMSDFDNVRLDGTATSVNPPVAPEPASLLLLGTALAASLRRVRRAQRG